MEIRKGYSSSGLLLQPLLEPAWLRGLVPKAFWPNRTKKRECFPLCPTGGSPVDSGQWSVGKQSTSTGATRDVDLGALGGRELSVRA
jgi:hypothetical protein